MEKIKNQLNHLSHILEFIVAIIVLLSILVSIFHLYEPFMEFVMHGQEGEYFIEFLTSVFNVVIGIEFLRMLCTTDINTVLEVIIFVLARHLIIYELSALDSLLTVFGIVIIFLVKKYYNQKPDIES
ncbi:hypothetical protein [Floccifex sp.]|uniref:hypothetical protein n=1 Tax=Floccifex sp. TaxID=2815810 RepID=UPI003EFEF395